MKSHTFTQSRGHLPEFDELDRQLLQALQLNGRAPFNRIAEVLGVSDQTIARRYSRLRSAGSLRVLGMTDPLVLGEVAWFVRVHCAPDAASPVAEALARRDDTSWVSLTSGGTEIVCVARAGADEDSNALLLQKLPHTPTGAGCDRAVHPAHVLRRREKPDQQAGRLLTAEQIDALVYPVLGRATSTPAR